jgi:hypothetical protein
MYDEQMESTVTLVLLCFIYFEYKFTKMPRDCSELMRAYYRENKRYY